VHNLTPWPIDRYFSMAVHSRHTRLTDCRSDVYISAPFIRIVAYQNDFFIVVFHAGITYHQPSSKLPRYD